MLSYVFCWIMLCFGALTIIIHDRRVLLPEWRIYVEFLCVKWKLALFIPALIFVTFAGKYTDDETWDVITGSGMSILTFLTAPWCTGLIYQIVKKQRPADYIIVALALCLFSSSWFYDGYLLIRDGHYTQRWFGNLLLSPIIYVSAGLLWNLEADGRLTATFSFKRSDWPAAPINKNFLPLVPVIIPLICVAAYVLTGFVSWHF